VDNPNVALAWSWHEAFLYWEKINASFLKAVIASGDSNVNEVRRPLFSSFVTPDY
jgi:hypothetical protein